MNDSVIEADQTKVEAAGSREPHSSEVEDSIATSPILNLPTDVLLLIVKACANEDKDFHVFSIRAIQWAFSQTCRSWRGIALDSPLLWKVIRINGKRYAYPKDSFSMLRTWLSRSQSVPISCFVVLNGYLPVDQDQPIEAAIMDLIVRNSRRWQDISLWLGSRPALYIRVGSIQRPLPLLRFFQMFAATAPPEDNSERTPRTFTNSAFAVAPNLTEVDIDVSPYSSPIPLPWRQLQFCRYGYQDPGHLFDKAATLQNLRHLTLSVFPPGFPIDSLRQFTLTGLLRLEANLQTLNAVASLLDVMFLPSLRDFKTDPFFADGGDSLPSSIVNLQKRSSCKLKRLSIPLKVMSSPSWPELAKALSSVEELHVRIHYYPPYDPSSPVLSMTCLKDRSLLPSLKDLYLVFHFAEECPIPANDTFFNELADVVTTRRKPNQSEVRLESLSIDTAITYVSSVKDWVKPDIPVDVWGIQRMMDLQSQGLKFIKPFVADQSGPAYRRATHWDAESVGKDATRYLL